jgi:hypothetical protein
MPPSRRRTWILRSGLVLLSTGLVVWLGLSLLLAWTMTSRAEPPYEEPLTDRWPNVEELRLETSDGQRLGAWFAPGEGRGPAVILLHGNGGGRSSMVGRGQLVLSEGAAVLAPTLRAHGDSTDLTPLAPLPDAPTGCRSMKQAACPARPLRTGLFYVGPSGLGLTIPALRALVEPSRRARAFRSRLKAEG